MSRKVAALNSKETQFVKGLWVSNAIVLGLLLGGSFIFGSPKAAFSVIVGGAIALANFRLMQVAMARILTPNAKKVLAMGATLILYYLRFGITMAVLAFLLSRQMVEPFGLLLGLSVVVITMITYGLISVRKLG